MNTTPAALVATPVLPDPPEVLWQAVLARTPRQDCVYAVRSTGIYCRPGCAARRPRRANVHFFATPAQAEAAGYRACRRCRPDGAPAPDAGAALVARACGLLTAADAPATVGALAVALGVSPWQLQRAFRTRLGVSPGAWVRARRAARWRQTLPDTPTVTEALYAAGFGSASRAHAVAPGALGMTPRAFRAGGRGETIRHTVVGCGLGWLLVAATARGICAVEFGDAPEALRARLRQRFAQAEHGAPDREFEAWVGAIVRAVDAGQAAPELPLDLRGSAFQCRVWAALRGVPPGQTVTYGELARRIGAPRAARAVGTACGANTLAVLVPCHRAVPAAGGTGQYRWGSERKRSLLAREAARAPQKVRPGAGARHRKG